MKQKELLSLLIFTFIVVLAWTGFSLYHAIRTSTISKEQAQTITPISPSFDAQTLAAIKERSTIVPLFTVSQTASTSSQTSQTQNTLPQGLLTPRADTGNALSAPIGIPGIQAIPTIQAPVNTGSKQGQIQVPIPTP